MHPSHCGFGFGFLKRYSSSHDAPNNSPIPEPPPLPSSMISNYFRTAGTWNSKRVSKAVIEYQDVGVATASHIIPKILQSLIYWWQFKFKFKPNSFERQKIVMCFTPRTQSAIALSFNFRRRGTGGRRIVLPRPTSNYLALTKVRTIQYSGAATRSRAPVAVSYALPCE